MFDYVTGYVVFGAMFLLGAAGYWVVVRAFGDGSAIYELSLKEGGGPKAAP